ncbi:hypothetical protein J4211_02395 [Candidatus Woesearchaeota archaeon]|nr:hypothetical protein [Candidatus Woesearchaeota archaeon]
MEDLLVQFLIEAPFRYPVSMLGLLVLLAGFVLHYAYGTFRWLMLAGIFIIFLGLVIGEHARRQKKKRN